MNTFVSGHILVLSRHRLGLDLLALVVRDGNLVEVLLENLVFIYVGIGVQEPIHYIVLQHRRTRVDRPLLQQVVRGVAHSVADFGSFVGRGLQLVMRSIPFVLEKLHHEFQALCVIDEVVLELNPESPGLVDQLGGYEKFPISLTEFANDLDEIVKWEE